MSKSNVWYTKQYMKKQEAKTEMALDVMALFLVGDAKLRVTVLTGNLRGSITSDKEKLARGVGTIVEYAPHVELGTEKQEAKPFLKPALDENYEQLQKFYTKVMSK